MTHRILRTALILALICLSVGTLTAQNSGKPFSSPNFPVPFGPDNTGTEFYVAFPANWEYQATKKYVRFYISSGVETKVDIYALGQFKGSITTIPNDIVTFDLSNLEAQVFVRSDLSPLPEDQVYINKAVRIVSEDPIIVYGMNRTDFTSDGMLILPVNALGQEYVVASAASVAGGAQELPSQYMICAPYDNTSVTINNPQATPNHAEGQTFTITMNKGDVFSAMSVGATGDLSGAYISATKPIAVTAGQNCTYLPSYEFPACDHIEEMLTPIESWGKYYQAIPYQNRTRGDTYRIFAGEPNAEVYINGVKQATLSRVGGTSGIGWVEYREEARRPLEFSSNKRIFVAQYNNSQTYDNAGGSDPFYVILTPVEQYQKDLIFTTPGSDFPLNFISIIADSVALADAEITKAGTENWQKLTLLGGNIYTFPTQINGKKYQGASLSIAPGAYQLRSTGPVAGYIYAAASFDSYGYPLSVATANLSKPDKDAPTVIGDPDCNGTVSGQVRDLPDDDAIRTNINTIRLHPNSTNYTLTVEPFTPGVTRSTTYTLTVKDLKQDARAILVAIDGAANATFDTVQYYARNVGFLPDPVDFDEVLINDSKELPVKIKNSGNRRIDIRNVLVQKGTTGFEIIDPTGSFSLNPGEERSVTVRFSGTVAGVFLDSLGFADDCGTFWVSLARAEVVAPIITVSDLDFELWPVGQTRALTMEISNSGSGTLNISGVKTNITDPVFTLPNGLPAFPLNLKPGIVQKLEVHFRPTAEQFYIDSIVFEHNAPANPANDPVGIVQGRGIQSTLVATSFDWSERRVGTGPWPATVTIKNLGSDKASIFGIKSKVGDGTEFNVDGESGIQNIEIPAGGEIQVAVSFKPTSVGNKKLKIIYNVTDPSDTTLSSTLTGIGVVPGLGTTDLDFGTMRVGDPEVMKTVDFNLIRNYPSSIVGDFRDTVWIDRFDFVSDDGGSGNMDFRFDPPIGGFPIVLVRGENEFVTITGYFSAKAVGLRNGSILARTRDGVDTISRWIGVGTVQNSGGTVTATPGPSLCLGETDSLFVTITSNGAVPLNITGITLNSPSGEFTLVNPPGTPFAVLPGNSRKLTVNFTPNQNGARSATLTVTTDDPNNPSIVVELTGDGAQFDIPGKLVLLGTNVENGFAVLGETLKATVRADDVLDPVGATGYKVTMTYNSKELIAPLTTTDITLSPLVHSPASVVTIDPTSTAGTLILNVSSPTPLVGVGDMITVPFGVVFDTNLSRQIDVDVEFTTGARCATINVSGAQLAVTPICGLNLRLIELVHNGKFALTGATPNPVSKNGTEIEYSIGLDGPTQVLLYDATGTYVATLVNQYQQPGLYRVGLDATNLSSGLYYCVLQSSQYREVKPVMIAK